ncbi:hypothetical protein ACFO1B_25600 [Dactylosporangium siamense]|uniref:Uncharacterized protein n=1 Tax=Dactylosporangium siamense TaxID=685454 RepID=A0A919PNQ0_9ACTN|nr:hypothetical protein [Dactylosporangium siamense]GIG47324.1 hypothetical protein Dsi01nite_053650 [Dactylosporangium siamense]
MTVTMTRNAGTRVVRHPAPRQYLMLLPSVAAIALGVAMLLDPLIDGTAIFVVVAQLLLLAAAARLGSVRALVAGTCLIAGLTPLVALAF